MSLWLMLAAMPVATAAESAMARSNDRQERREELIEKRVYDFEDSFDVLEVEGVGFVRDFNFDCFDFDGDGLDIKLG